MARLLVVHHTVSPPLDTLLQAALDGARTPEVDDVDVEAVPALRAGAIDVLDADGYLLGTPANLGSMAGALKHFFDTVYYPCLEATKGRPWALYVHGNSDVDGAIRDVERIVTGLGWKAAAAPLRVVGPPDRAATDGAWELGATLAATIGG
ncbi:MAG: flavodoxin family protein [Acidimicrobiales bacterium]|nr:flavodoxin family protein [Acidimicrobiales bacterium]